MGLFFLWVRLLGPFLARTAMSFAVGDKVVYPHHGAAIIEGKERRPFDGKKTDYFVLRITYGDLKVSIPVDKADEIGLREVINDEEVEEVFTVLRKKEARMPTNWSRRFKNHVEKLKSGDIYQVAEVVRNLSLREADKGLSAGEKRMLARARQILVSELVFALNVDEETADSRLDDVLAGRDVPPVKKAKPKAKPAAKQAPAKKPAATKAAPAVKATKAPAKTSNKAVAAKKPVKAAAKTK
jgi:CarD family transcriptional regulator